MLDVTGKVMQVGQVLISVMVGVLVYALMAIMMRMEEVRMMLSVVRRKLYR